MDATATAKPVVVGIDGSTRAAEILEWALGEALICQATLRVVTVWNWDGLATPRPSTHRPAGWARQAQETLVARVLARFGSPAPQVTSEVTEGDPATQLIQRSSDAELLVVGGDPVTREPGARTVAEVCRRHACCPVVVVPPTGRVPRPTGPARPAAGPARPAAGPARSSAAPDRATRRGIA
jgi:nucleotide-binding universal stress UspA family protein